MGQLYDFTDKGDREVALRPEMTPTLARMVAARANGLKKPIRWFSIPQLFRYERQQRGRLREHFQLNCDLIGEAGPLADAEIIALAIDLMRAFGLGPRKDVRVRVSDRRVLTALLKGKGVPDAGLHLRVPVHRQDRPTAAGGYRKAAAQVRRHSPGDRDQIVAEISTDPWHCRRVEQALAGCARCGVEALGPLRQRCSALSAHGPRRFVDVDLTIVRGLAYYTGTVFELFDAGKTLRAICGGGRYDNLLKRSGECHLPAVGFGMGDVVLGELLKERGLVPPHRSSVDVFLAAIARRICPTCSGWPTSCATRGCGSNSRWAPARWASSSSWPTPATRGWPWSSARTTVPGAKCR